jgi:hypothetical protein
MPNLAKLLMYHRWSGAKHLPMLPRSIDHIEEFIQRATEIFILLKEYYNFTAKLS